MKGILWNHFFPNRLLKFIDFFNEALKICGKGSHREFFCIFFLSGRYSAQYLENNTFFVVLKHVKNKKKIFISRKLQKCQISLCDDLKKCIFNYFALKKCAVDYTFFQKKVLTKKSAFFKVF